MSDSFLPMLLANLQQTLVEQGRRIEALEQQMAQIQVVEDEDGEPETYMDGSPVL